MNLKDSFTDNSFIHTFNLTADTIEGRKEQMIDQLKSMIYHKKERQLLNKIKAMEQFTDDMTELIDNVDEVIQDDDDNYDENVEALEENIDESEMITVTLDRTGTITEDTHENEPEYVLEGQSL